MIRLLRPIVLITAFAGVGSLAFAQCNANCSGPNCPDRRTISVTGTAQVTADADLAVVRVGYKLYAVDAKSAYDQAASASNAIMDALTAAGIPKSAIESTSQVLQHTSPFEMQQVPNPKSEEERKEHQFTATQSWTIRVKPDQAAKALDTAVGAGANESGWIQWIVTDPSTLQAQASSDAVANARKIAEEIAAKSGVRLGQLVSANENQPGMAYAGAGFVTATVGSIYGMGDATFVAGSGPGIPQQLAINSRRVEFRVSVNAVFAIEDQAAVTK